MINTEQMKMPARLGRSSFPPTLSLLSFSRSCTPPLGSSSQATLALNLLGHALLVSMALLLSCFCSSVHFCAFRIRRVFARATVRPFQHFLLWRPAARCPPPYFDHHSFRLYTALIYHPRIGVGQFHKFWFIRHRSAPSIRSFFDGL